MHNLDGIDYNSVSEALTFSPTSSRACLMFTTLEDEILEEDTEDLTLSLVSSDNLDISLNPIRVQVSILDDGDGK